MPFTTAHPAIVLPLKKLFPRYLSLTGLMAGSMSPDLIYFLGFSTAYRGLSHTWIGLFWFCVPAGVLFSVVFHRLFKRPFIENLPAPLDRHLSGLTALNWRPKGGKGWLILVASVFLGALSHFFWDSFTHPTGELARAIPFLKQYHEMYGLWFSSASVAQHLSTIVGTLVLVFAAYKGNLLPGPVSAAAKATSKDKAIFWLNGTLASVAVGFGAVWAINQWFPGNRAPNISIFGVSSWAGFFYFVVIYGFIKKVRFSGNSHKNR